jgi:hypothetical protein
MKKLSILFLSLFFTISYSQTEEVVDSSDSKSKIYVGVGLGLSSASLSDDFDADLSTGLNVNFINLGYRFSETWGATLNLSSAGHVLKDEDDISVGIAYLGIGPMYTFSLSERVSWDLKPQLAFNLTGVVEEDGELSESTLEKGTGFVFGNSLVFGDGAKGFSFSVDLDYMSGKFKSIEEDGVSVDLDSIDFDGAISNFKLGVGVRYNF